MKPRTKFMLQIFFRVLEVIFFVGLAGSLVVAILAFIGDIIEFRDKH